MTIAYANHGGIDTASYRTDQQHSLKKWLRFVVLALCLAVVLSGCASHRPHIKRDGPPLYDNIDPNTVPDAVPKAEPYSKYGNPTSYVIRGKRYHVLRTCDRYHERGVASWYGTLFHKQRTSSGEPYDMFKITAAHKTLPIPSYARVTNLKNGKTVIVKINDRGPFAEGRIMDLSYMAARKLGFMGKGTGLIDVELINPGSAPRPSGVLPYKSPRAQIYLQVGVFSQKALASQQQRRIQAFSRYPVMIRSMKHHLYRVLIGPMDRVEDSEMVSRHLKSKHIAHTTVTVE